MDNVNPALKLRELWLAVGYALVILVIYLSVTSSPVKLDMAFPYQDKFFHALAYFTLMFWFAQIYHDAMQRRILAVIFLLLGLLMEFVQSMDPMRTAEFADMLANTAGVLLAFFLTGSIARFVLLKVESVIFRQR